MASAHLRARRRIEAAKEGFHGAMMCLFALAVIAVFIIAELVGIGAITMPDWSKSLTKFSAAERNAYGGAMLGSACFFLAVFCAVGLYLQRREARQNAQMTTRGRV